MNSKTTRDFRLMLFELPKEVQQTAYKNYKLWKENHYHNSLQFKKLADINSEQSIYSVRIGLYWRSLGVYRKETDTIIWYWVGSHAEYDRIIS